MADKTNKEDVKILTDGSRLALTYAEELSAPGNKKPIFDTFKGLGR